MAEQVETIKNVEVKWGIQLPEKCDKSCKPLSANKRWSK
jgi:hypothetical protein